MNEKVSKTTTSDAPDPIMAMSLVSMLKSKREKSLDSSYATSSQIPQENSVVVCNEIYISKACCRRPV